MDCKKANKILTCHSVSCRKYCTPPVSSNILGNFLVPFLITSTIKQQVDQMDLWEMAKEISSELHSNKFVGLLSFISKLISWIPPKAQEPPKENLGRNTFIPFNISNRGHFANVSQSFGPFTLLKTFWTTAEHHTGFPHTHNVVSFGGELFWSITYYTHVSTLEQVAGYAQEIVATIENI